jgi:hypothetical protein
MESQNSNTFTQKDLMQHLLQVSQHTATRDELNNVRHELISYIDKRFAKLEDKMDKK